MYGVFPCMWMNVCVCVSAACVWQKETERNDKTAYVVVKTKLKSQVIDFLFCFSFLNSNVILFTWIFYTQSVLEIKLFSFSTEEKKWRLTWKSRSLKRWGRGAGEVEGKEGGNLLLRPTYCCRLTSEISSLWKKKDLALQNTEKEPGKTNSWSWMSPFYGVFSSPSCPPITCSKNFCPMK